MLLAPHMPCRGNISIGVLKQSAVQTRLDDTMALVHGGYVLAKIHSVGRRFFPDVSGVRAPEPPAVAAPALTRARAAAGEAAMPPPQASEAAAEVGQPAPPAPRAPPAADDDGWEMASEGSDAVDDGDAQPAAQRSSRPSRNGADAHATGFGPTASRRGVPLQHHAAAQQLVPSRTAFWRAARPRPHQAVRFTHVCARARGSARLAPPATADGSARPSGRPSPCTKGDSVLLGDGRVVISTHFKLAGGDWRFDRSEEPAAARRDGAVARRLRGRQRH